MGLRFVLDTTRRGSVAFIPVMVVDARSHRIRAVDRSGDDSELGDILTVNEVAEYLKIPKQTVYRMVRSGDLRAFKAGKHWRVQRVELGTWIARQSGSEERAG